MNSTYELTVIVRPELSEDERDKVLSKIEALVTGAGGEIKSRDMWGRRELAYSIKKYTEGVYVLFTFNAPNESIKDIDYKVKINDDIIRHLLVKAEK
jgi:small subunit ribosomal protein S6